MFNITENILQNFSLVKGIISFIAYSTMNGFSSNKNIFYFKQKLAPIDCGAGTRALLIRAGYYIYLEKKSVFSTRPDTKFVRKGSVLVTKAGHLIY